VVGGVPQQEVLLLKSGLFKKIKKPGGLFRALRVKLGNEGNRGVGMEDHNSKDLTNDQAFP